MLIRHHLKNTQFVKTLHCIGFQVSNYTMALQRTADIINGPTLGTSLSPFEWTPDYKQSHVGLPEKYDFPFIQTKPMNPPN